MDAKALCERLGIEFNEEIVPFYEKAVSMYNEKGDDIVRMDRVLELNKKYNFIRHRMDAISEAAKNIAKDPDMLLFTYICYFIIKADSPLAKMTMPNKDNDVTDLFLFFSFFYCFPEIIERMEKRGLPLEIISDTLQGFEAEMTDYEGVFGRPGIRIYMTWFMIFYRCDILRIGRLNFEMTKFEPKLKAYKKGDDIKVLVDGEYVHKKGMLFGSAGQENEEGRYYAEITEDGDTVTGYAANYYGECVPEKITLTGYEEILKKGDNIISTHIPAALPFTVEIAMESIERAKEIFEKYYPDFTYKTFCTFTWMLEKRLKDIMGRETNITRFADLFTAFPLKNDGRDVYSYLFHVDGGAAEDLPENTGMQRAVKEYLKAGNYYYDKGGILVK